MVELDLEACQRSQVLWYWRILEGVNQDRFECWAERFLQIRANT